MHKLTFHPLGNADCCRIILENGKRILFDYANTRDPKDPKDVRCKLDEVLRDDLKSVKRDYFDVVAFSHLDEDHYKGATEFFWLEYAKEYQGSDRIKITTMWVPAALITEPPSSLDKDEARTLQKEARHRFKQGTGIRVFSRPDRLRDWCKENGVDFDKHKHLITDAGQIAPEFSLTKDGVEFFVHSPFAKRLNEKEVEDRNQDSIVLHVTFVSGGSTTKVWLMADCTHENISEFVDITRKVKKREERLEWHVAKIPHHCSYLSLSEDKGEDKTVPDENIAWLWEQKGQEHGIMVSSNEPMPAKGTSEDADKYPPHRQAGNYYKGVMDDHDGDFVVTMENGSQTNPRPVEIEIDGLNATLKKTSITASVAAAVQRAPRAG